jgi:hypothetical protein
MSTEFVEIIIIFFFFLKKKVPLVIKMNILKRR